MKTLLKKDFLFVEFPDDILETSHIKLEQIFKSTIEQEKYNFVIDFKNTKFLSSRIISTILKNFKKASAIDKRFCIINPSEKINDTLNFTNINKIIDVFENEETMRIAYNIEKADFQEDTFSYGLQCLNNCAIIKMSGTIKYLPVLKEMEEDIINKASSVNYNFIFNLKGVNFIDSVGVSRFVKIYKFLKNNDGKVVICCLGELVFDLLKIMNLSEIFEIYETEEEAKNIF